MVGVPALAPVRGLQAFLRGQVREMSAAAAAVAAGCRAVDLMAAAASWAVTETAGSVAPAQALDAAGQDAARAAAAAAAPAP